MFAPLMIHDNIPTATETAFGSDPCCVVSVTSGHIAFTAATMISSLNEGRLHDTRFRLN